MAPTDSTPMSPDSALATALARFEAWLLQGHTDSEVPLNRYGAEVVRECIWELELLARALSAQAASPVRSPMADPSPSLEAAARALRQHVELHPTGFSLDTAAWGAMVEFVAAVDALSALDAARGGTPDLIRASPDALIRLADALAAFSTTEHYAGGAVRSRLAALPAARGGTEPTWDEVYETLAGLVDGNECEWRGDYCMAHSCKGRPCDNAVGRDLLARIAPLARRASGAPTTREEPHE